MPSITLNKNVFEKLVGKKLPVEKLKDRISMLGTDLEDIRGNEINVEVFPNRPDMLSEQGFARAFSSFIGVKKGLREYKAVKSGERVIVDKSVKDVRPYTACAIVKGIKFDDEKIKEVINIQEKLHITYGRNRKKVAIGIYPNEKIKYPIRFLARNPYDIKFRPLDSKNVMDGFEIVRTHSTGKEYGYLLEGKDKFPIFIDANDKILSMPPIINSEEIGRVSEKTKDVFIECSGFDFGSLKICLNIIVTALADMGGKIYSVELIDGKRIVSPDLKAREMKLSINYTNKLLGLDLKESDVKKLLERMGYSYRNKKVLVPCYRADVLHEMDIVEDIAIAYGYENFKEEIPNVSTIGEENKFFKFKKKIRDLLIGHELVEINSYNITNGDEQTKLMGRKIELVELENSKTEYNCLRAWIIPDLLMVLKGNRHYDYPQNIFEVGSIFKLDKDSETGVLEDERVAVLFCNNKTDFTQAKQLLDNLFDLLKLKYDIQETEHESFIPGRVGRILVNGKKVAYIGEIHPSVLSNFGIDMPVAGFELNLSELFNLI